MLTVACTPRSMSAWLSNLLTVPGQSLYVHDPMMEPGLEDALAAYDIPKKGVVNTGWLLDTPPPDLVILGDPDHAAEGMTDLIGEDGPAVSDFVFERLQSCGAPAYQLSEMNSWIREFYETCTGLEFDPVRYSCLLNLYIECQFAASARQGQVRYDTLQELHANLRGHAVPGVGSAGSEWRQILEKSH